MISKEIQVEEKKSKYVFHDLEKSHNRNPKEVMCVIPDNQSRATGLIGQVSENQVGGYSFDKTFFNLRTNFQFPFLVKRQLDWY